MLSSSLGLILPISLLFLLINQLSRAAIQLPYGVEEGDELVQFPDGPVAAQRNLPAAGQFAFFERRHNSLFISANGAVSFGIPFDRNAAELDLQRKDIIAVFYAPSASSGEVFYRTAASGNLLTKELSAKIRRAFGASQFEADSVMLITWDEVQNEKGEANTFQLALAANSNETYALLVYSTIRWTRAGDSFAQAGFFSADGRNEKLPNSGSAAVGDVLKVTNFNEPGMFVYRVSGAHPIDPRFGQKRGRSSAAAQQPQTVVGEEEYEYTQDQQDYDSVPEDQLVECPPDPYRDNCPQNCNLVLDDNHCSLCICSSVVSENLAGSAYSKLTANEIAAAAGRSARLQPPQQPQSLRAPDLSCTPQQSQTQCHVNANCLQHQSGYCCHCERGHVGNGAECLAAEVPLRINGVFEAALNGKSVQRTDLFSYIQPQEGQQHTALAKIQADIGWSLLLLDSLSIPFGWLFAKTRPGGNAQNGFELTGGNFTRNVNIHLGERFSLAIRQEFTDRQFSEHFGVSVFVSGTLPEIQGPVHVSIPEFEETYRRERPGLIRAYSERYVLVRGGSGTPNEETKYRVTTDQQIHFTECPFKEPKGPSSQTVKFERLNANFNEAENVVRFASQSSVLSEASSGEEEQTPPGGQQDACASGRHFCTLANMVCVPIPMNPGYRCECRPGFRLIEDNNVEQRMVCQQLEQPENIVLPAPAYRPTAPAAALQPGECFRHDQCHQWGECVFGPLPGQPGKCKCRGWYIGDGITHCGPPDQTAQHVPQQPQQQQQQPSAVKGTLCRSDSECGDNAACQYSESHGYYVCQCASGWRGDGIDCLAEAEPALDGEAEAAEDQRLKKQPQQTGPMVGQQQGQLPTPRKQCTDASDCHPLYGSCILSEQTGAFFCVCLPGFQGDGVEQCDRSEECHPTEPSQGCPDSSQECRFEHGPQKFTCQCRGGFTKQPDGKCAYQLDQASPCQQCGANAQCIRGGSGGDEEWNCVCNAGFTGNGFECRREANCLDEPAMCSPDAQCLPDGQRAYLCVCNYGFTGDGRTCEPLVERSTKETETLLIGRGMAIIQRPARPSENGKQLVVQPHQIVVDIEYDCVAERIYWSDISGHSLRSARLNGTEISVQFADVLRSPEGIAIDWRSRNIYYLDSIKNELGVLSADGRFQKTLLKEGLNNPRALVIDLEGRKLYYSDWSRGGPKIGSIGLDGSGNQVFLSEDIHLPNGLVLLQQRRWLCWVDAGVQRLSCIGLDGSGRRVIYAPLEYPFGFAVNSQEDRFYWTDWKDQKIHSVDVFGKDYTEFLPGAGGRGKLYGILSLPVKCHFHSAPSECVHENGGCGQLWCLPGPTAGTKTCVCPDNQAVEGC